MVKAVSTNLAILRRARSLSQADLGEAAGISRNHYQLLESGAGASGGAANPRLSTLSALARTLEVDVTTLLQPPSAHAFWQWIDVHDEPSDDFRAALLDQLLTRSARELGGSGAAFVGWADGSMTVGIGVLASGSPAATIVGRAQVEAALTEVGLAHASTDEFEVDAGLDGLSDDGHI
ncbi:helix-turn-helix transcriptional regulator [Nocardioides sp. KIGAM211]|uniref:Helix-turn-helix transcriptional regulator n=1 Tax=Nocardioides luti TaxID=2761101 RepID=A0A7X0RFZ6_9ACTN|nr:helix-turn-helix transcriptional regulator [Nocardioides luti]